MARNKHPEETVEKILDVSMRLFSEKGYEHTTIQDIVDALGMSKGAIYHHFKSKEDIIDRLNDRYYEGLDWFPDLSKIPGENGLEKLRYAFRHFLTDPAKRKVDRLVIGYVVKNPKITLLTLESTFRDAAPYVEKIIRLGMADGSIQGVEYPGGGGAHAPDQRVDGHVRRQPGGVCPQAPLQRRVSEALRPARAGRTAPGRRPQLLRPGD